MNSAQARGMARYNQWMNEKVYAAAATLDDTGRRLDRGAFFASIHGTLNHLMVGDRIWMDRFTGGDAGITRLDQELFADFDELRAERERLDIEIIDWAATLDDHALAGDFEFTGTTNAVRRRGPFWFVVSHFFNHQTHHRGQVSTLLWQAGRDIGVTDLSYLPGMLETID